MEVKYIQFHLTPEGQKARFIETADWSGEMRIDLPKDPTILARVVDYIVQDGSGPLIDLPILTDWPVTIESVLYSLSVYEQKKETLRIAGEQEASDVWDAYSHNCEEELKSFFDYPANLTPPKLDNPVDFVYWNYHFTPSLEQTERWKKLSNLIDDAMDLAIERGKKC